MSYLEPELVHRWPWLHSKIALFSARPHTQSKGSEVANDRFSLYPLHCSHPARMKNTVQTHPLILLWIRPTAAQEPDSAISQPFTSFWMSSRNQTQKREQFKLKWKFYPFFLTLMSFLTHMTFFLLWNWKGEVQKSSSKASIFHTYKEYSDQGLTSSKNKRKKYTFLKDNNLQSSESIQ